MKSASMKLKLTEILIVLLVINYMVVTIVLHDNAIFKYLRDIVLLMLLFLCVAGNKHKSVLPKHIIGIAFFLVGVIIGVCTAPSVGIGITVARRYIFPLILLYCTSRFEIRYLDKFNRFLLIFFSIIAAFGVIQAQILGDSFLRRLGYPLVYSYYYKRDMLYNSFYFGGFGIQRVVATLSSSNICGLILGLTLIYSLICYKYIKMRHKKLCICFIILGYLLTFSRSNFLALVIVTVLIVWPYIPHKKQILISIFILAIVLLIVGIYQGKSGMMYRMVNWVQSSFNFTESSAAGRSGIWKDAFAQVIRSPLGIGMGHVGGMADQVGVSELRFSSENSYLALALDTGWIGLIGYVTFLITECRYVKRKSIQCKASADDCGRRLCIASYSMLIYFFVVIFFSNHINDMEVVCMLYVYLGLALSFVHGKIDVSLRTLS